MAEKMWVSKSETICTQDIRKLMEVAKIVNRILTRNEYAMIMSVYKRAIERLEKENEEGSK